MREFNLRGDDILVRRGVVDAFVAAFGPYKTRGERVVCRHIGIESLGDDPDGWFPAPGFLAAMNELQGQFGGAFMRKVGSFIFDKAVFPPGIDTVSKGMELVDTAYRMNHSESASDRIGAYRWRATSVREGVMVCDGPYPCAFDVGILETIARRFHPTAHALHEPGTCRRDGADSCAYRVAW